MSNVQPSQPNTPKRGHAALSLRKKIRISVIALLVWFIAIEIICRVAAFGYYGFNNTYYLLYGIKSWEMRLAKDSTPYDGYFKFKPRSRITQGPKPELRIPSQINNIGLRGTHDLAVKKPAGGFRVVCLGESSTFGYHARDEYTYPAQLERMLQQQISNHPVEVINAGIPNFDSSNLVAILENELLAYEPDVITVYAGYNDMTYVLDATWGERVGRWLHGHLLTYVLLKHLVQRVSGLTLHSKWATYLASPPPEYVQKQIELHVAKYRANLERIIGLARSRGASVVLVRQPMTTYEKLQMGNARPDYAQEVADVLRRHQQGERVSGEELGILIHSKLIACLDDIAREQGLPVVDNIALVDARKDRLLTYVHLSEEGNEALAKTLQKAIVPIAAKKFLANKTL